MRQVRAQDRATCVRTHHWGWNGCYAHAWIVGSPVIVGADGMVWCWGCRGGIWLFKTCGLPCAFPFSHPLFVSTLIRCRLQNKPTLHQRRISSLVSWRHARHPDRLIDAGFLAHFTKHVSSLALVFVSTVANTTKNTISQQCLED